MAPSKQPPNPQAPKSEGLCPKASKAEASQPEDSKPRGGKLGEAAPQPVVPASPSLTLPSSLPTVPGATPSGGGKISSPAHAQLPKPWAGSTSTPLKEEQPQALSQAPLGHQSRPAQAKPSKQPSSAQGTGGSASKASTPRLAQSPPESPASSASSAPMPEFRCLEPPPLTVALFALTLAFTGLLVLQALTPFQLPSLLTALLQQVANLQGLTVLEPSTEQQVYYQALYPVLLGLAVFYAHPTRSSFPLLGYGALALVGAPVLALGSLWQLAVLPTLGYWLGGALALLWLSQRFARLGARLQKQFQLGPYPIQAGLKAVGAALWFNCVGASLFHLLGLAGLLATALLGGLPLEHWRAWALVYSGQAFGYDVVWGACALLLGLGLRWALSWVLYPPKVCFQRATQQVAASAN